MHTELPLWVPALLVLVVWSVYIGDRLLDAFSALRSARTQRLRERHYFHWRHRRILLPLAVVAASAAGLLIACFMPVGIRQRDSLLALAALAYMTRVHARPRLPQSINRTLCPLLSKELLVGILFTAGCALPALGRAAAPPTAALFIAFGFFALLAWLNCHAIERWETETAQAVAPSGASFATPGILGLLGLLSSAAFFVSQPRPAALIACAALSALLLAMLHHLRARLSPTALRAAADLALLTPVLLVPLLFVSFAGQVR